MEEQESSLGRNSAHQAELRWTEASLDEICAISSGITKGRKPPAEPLAEVPYMAVANVQDGRLNLDLVKTIHASAAEIQRYQLLPGDLLLTEGGDPDKLGRGTVWNSEINPCIHQNHIFRVRAISELIDMGFLSRLVASPRGKSYFLSKAKQTTGIASINLTQLRAFPVLLPPLNEQRRIASKLDTTLAAVESCRQRLDGVAELLKRFRQAVLAAATSGALTREWREENQIEQEWCSGALGDLLRGKPRNGYSPKPADHETPVKSLTLSATTTGRFLEHHFKYISEAIDPESHLWLQPGDILIQRANTLEYVGVSALYEGRSDEFIYPDLMMKCQSNEEVIPQFLHYLLLSERSRSFFRANATGTSGNMPKINQQIVLSLPVRWPSLREQQEIIERAQDLFTLADQLEARLTSARRVVERLTPALLAKAFRGELVPQDPSDEPASALLERIRAARQAEAAAGKPSRRGRKPVAAHPDQASLGLESKPAAVASDPVSPDPVPPDQLATLLQECGPLSEKALLAASELEPGRFLRQLQLELQAGTIREALEEGERVLVGG